MKLNIEINNLSKDSIEESFLKGVIKKTFNFFCHENKCLDGKNISVSMALVFPREIRKLNRIYRKKDLVTDVLSFSECKSQKELLAVGDKDMFLGEIVLCYNYIKEYAKKNQEREKVELARVVSHGILHLLGFRHGEKMFRIQNNVVQNVK